MAHDNPTLQGADHPHRFLAWTGPQWLLLAACALLGRLLLGRHGLWWGLPAALPALVCWLMGDYRLEPYLRNMTGWVLRRARLLLGRPLALGLTVHDGYLAMPSGLRAVVGVDTTSLDALTPAQQDVLCDALARLARTRQPGQTLQFLVVNAALDGAAVMADLAAGQARDLPSDLDALMAYDMAALGGHMRSRFVGTLGAYVVVGAPVRTLLGEQDALAGLRRATDTVRQHLGGLGLGTRLLDGDAVRALLATEPLTQDAVSDDHPRYVQTSAGYAATIALLEPCEVTGPGWLAPLITGLAVPYRLSIHIAGLDRTHESRRFSRRRNVEPEDDAGHAQHGKTLLQSQRTGVVRWGVYLTLQAPSLPRLRWVVAQALEMLEVDLCSRPARLLGHQLPAYWATLPIGVDTARRGWRIDTPTVGNAFPFLDFNPGTRGGLPLGFAAGNQLVRLQPDDPDHRNSIVNVYGLTGSGKCVDPNTLVWSKGLRRFEDIWGSDRIQGPHEVDRVMGWYDDGERDGFRVTTHAGFVIDGTANHRIWVRTADGYEGWRRLGELRGNEYVGLARGMADWGDEGMSADDAYTLGLVIADGSFSVSGQNQIVRVDKAHPVLERILPTLVRWRCAGGNMSTQPFTIHCLSPHHALVVISGRHLHAFLLNRYGLTRALSYDKQVPTSVLHGTRAVVQSFLRGYFDGDGYCTDRVEASTASRALAEQIQHLLLGLGVFATLRTKKTASGRLAYIMCVADTGAFAREVGFTSYGLTKDVAFRRLLESPRNPNIDTIPGLTHTLWGAVRATDPQPTRRDGIGATLLDVLYDDARTLSYGRLRRILPDLAPSQAKTDLERIVSENRAWTPIAAIAPSRIRRIDCAVDGSHAFVGNGLINHNTVTGLILLKWALYGGARGTVIERTGDPERGVPSHYATFCAIAGGTMLHLGASEPPALNMWDGDIRHIVGAHEIILGQPGCPFPPLWRSLLSQGVRAVTMCHAPSPPGRTPLERDLHAWFRQQAADSATPEQERDILREMAAILEPYVGDGEYAPLFDRPTSIDLQSRLLVFNTRGVAEHLNPVLMYLITEAIARRGRRAGEPAPLTLLDEGWAIAQYEAGARSLEEWGRRGRHTALYLVFLTQAVRDLRANPIARALFEAASITILMRLTDAGSDGVSELAAAFGLTEVETETVRRLQTTRDPRRLHGHAEAFLIRQSRTRASTIRHRIEIHTNPYDAAVFLSDPIEKVWLRQRLIEEMGSAWAGCKALAELGAADETPALEEMTAMADKAGIR